KVAAEEKKPPVQRLCEAIEETKHLPQESLFSGTNNTNTFTLVEYKPMSLRDFCVSLPNCPCTGTNPNTNFLYAKKIEKNDPGEGSDNPTWEVRYVFIDSLKDGLCDKTEGTQMPRRLGKLVFNYDKLVFEKNDTITDELFNFLQLTCVVITGTETAPPHFMSYLQLSTPVEIPPTTVTVPTDGSFAEPKPIEKSFKLNNSIRNALMRSQQALYKFKKNNLVWINATLRAGAVTTQPLSWTTQVNAANNHLPCTFKWKYKNDEAQSLEWLPLNQKQNPDIETTVFRTSWAWSWQNFPRIDWQHVEAPKLLPLKGIYKTVLDHVDNESALSEQQSWQPFCNLFLRSNLPRDIHQKQGDNYSKFTFTRDRLINYLSEDLRRRESILRSLKPPGAVAIAAKDKITDQIKRLEADYKKPLSLKQHIAFLKRSLLEKPWVELTKAAQDKLNKKEPEWQGSSPIAPVAPLEGAAKGEVDKYNVSKQKHLVLLEEYNVFKAAKAKFNIEIYDKTDKILDDEVKKYLELNEKKLSEVPANPDVFALYCHCLLWDKLKDMENKSLLEDDIVAMKNCLEAAELSIIFDVEIRWDSAAFPGINPSVFTESKGRPVSVVIKTNEKAPCLKPFTNSPSADGNATPSGSGLDVEPPKSPANSKADIPFDKP
ncbi:MAG: hypothetical protein WCG42_09985, partial [Parachlamydiaceae bacterium]